MRQGRGTPQGVSTRRKPSRCPRMSNHQNPFLRDGMLLRRTVWFGAALVAGFALVPLVAPGPHEPSDFTVAAILTVIMVLTVVVLPWRKLPTWIEMVPPLL